MDNKQEPLLDVFAHNVYYFRKKMGYTQEVLAEKIDVAPNTVWKIENSKEFPKVDKLEKLAEVLDVPPFQLLMRKEDLIFSKNQLLSVEQELHNMLSDRINDIVNPGSRPVNYDSVKRPHNGPSESN